MSELYEPLLSPDQQPKGPPSGALIFGEQPVTLDPIYYEADDLALHLHVAGGWGAGKSNFLRVLIGLLLMRMLVFGEGFGLVDPHGSLARYALHLVASQAPELADRLYYCDLHQQHRVMTFNQLQQGHRHPHFVASCVTEGLVKAHGAQGTSEKPLITRVLQNLIQALIEAGLSLTEAHYFLQRGQNQRAVFRSLLERMPATSPARSFFADLDAKPAGTADAYAMGPLNRLDPLIRPQAFRRMFAAPTVSLDVKALMDQGGILICDLSRAGAGVTVDGQHMLASLIVQEFRRVFEERTPDKSRPFTLVMDEFGDYVPADFARVITGARKYGLRAVFAHQHLTQLVSKDQDRTLLETVLAVPNKVIFGGMPFGDCRVLAEEMFLGAIDPDRIKYWAETVTWDPIPTKVTLTGCSRSESRTESHSTSSTRSEGTHSAAAAIASHGDSTSTGHGTSVDPESRTSENEQSGSGESWSHTTSQASGASSSVSDSEEHGFSTQYSFSESEQEAWTTFYEKRIQKGTPTYRSVEEQVFEYAKRLRMSPRGQGVMVSAGTPPREFRAPYKPDLDLTPADIQAFLDQVYDKPVYFEPEELDRVLKEREQKLLDAATRRPIVVSSASGRSRKKSEAHVASGGLFSSDARE